MGNKKKDLESLRRLKELERQLKEYTEEDYLREAEEMEREMAKQQVNFEPPEGFFEQVLAKGKLLEAEMRKQERIESGQKAQEKKVPRSAESGSAKADAILKMSVEQGQEQGGLQEKRESGLQKKEEAGLQEEVVSKEGLTGLAAAAAEESQVGESCVGKQYIGEQPANEQMSENMEGKAEDVRQKLKPLTFQTEEYGERVEIGGADQVSLRNVKLKESASEQRIGAETGNVESREKAAGEEMAKSRPGVWRSAGQASGRKPGRRKLRWRVLLVLGVLVVFMMFGVSSGGKRHFSFEQRQREGVEKQDVVLNNAEYIDGIDEEMEAYNKIEQEIGLDALKLGDRPYGVVFEGVEIIDNSAYLYFKSQKGDYILVKEAIYPYDTLVDVISDGSKIMTVHNDWLDIDVDIYEEEAQKNSYKYNAVISVDSMYYVITGYMELDSYISIIKDLNF